jgi:hypothetical protein
MKRQIPQPREFTVTFVTKPATTPNGNIYLECNTDQGRGAFWGSARNTRNIDAVLGHRTPFRVRAGGIEASALFLAIRGGFPRIRTCCSSRVAIESHDAYGRAAWVQHRSQQPAGADGVLTLWRHPGLPSLELTPGSRDADRYAARFWERSSRR